MDTEDRAVPTVDPSVVIHRGYSLEDCFVELVHLFQTHGADGQLLHELELHILRLRERVGETAATATGGATTPRPPFAPPRASSSPPCGRPHAGVLPGALTELREDVAIDFPRYDLARSTVDRAGQHDHGDDPAVFDAVWGVNGATPSMTTDDGLRFKDGCTLARMLGYIDASLQAKMRLTERELLFEQFKRCLERSHFSPEFRDTAALTHVERLVNAAVRDFNDLKRSSVSFMDRTPLEPLRLGQQSVDRSMADQVYRGVRRLYPDF